MTPRDEAAAAPAAIASVRDIADEIVVVATGPTDDTAARAAAAGATVVHSPWQDDFAAARNTSLAHCHGDWILVLDADERLAADSHIALRALIATPPAEPTACLVRMRNWTDDLRQDGFEHGAVRLFSRSPKLRFHGRIHEQLSHSDTGEGGIRWRQTPEVIIDHLGYAPAVMTQRGKVDRNLALLAQSIATEPADPAHHHHLGMVYWSTGQFPESLAALTEAIRLSAAVSEPMAFLKVAHTLQIACLVNLQQSAEALDLATACEGLCAAEPDYWFNVGLARQALGQHAAAIAALQRCLAPPTSVPYMAEMGTRTWKPWLRMAQSYAALADPAACLDAQWAALHLHRRLPDVHGRLWAFAVLADDGQRIATADRMWRQLTNDADRARVIEFAWDVLVANDTSVSAQGWADQWLPDLGHGHRLGLVVRQARLAGEAGGPAAQIAVLAAHFAEPGISPYLGQLYVETGDWNAYEALCQTLLTDDRDLAYAHLGIGNLFLRQGDIDGAEAAFRQATALGSDEPNLWNNLGLIALSRRKVAEAEQHFLATVRLDPDHFSANLNLIRTAWFAKDAARATACLATAVASLKSLLEKPYTAPTVAATHDFFALYTYFQRWDLSRHRNAATVVPDGADAFLKALYQAWQVISARQFAKHQA
ncbi:MAG: tetratricopeptide repeat protein [Candidatus Sericytochromatia bacterium]|nr:tetratricopeptide repeat protein [Candidatus Sericytochromatia bacterium]